MATDLNIPKLAETAYDAWVEVSRYPGQWHWKELTQTSRDAWCAAASAAVRLARSMDEQNVGTKPLCSECGLPETFHTKHEFYEPVSCECGCGEALTVWNAPRKDTP